MQGVFVCGYRMHKCMNASMQGNIINTVNKKYGLDSLVFTVLQKKIKLGLEYPYRLQYMYGIYMKIEPHNSLLI